MVVKIGEWNIIDAWKTKIKFYLLFRLMFIWPTTIVHKIDRHSPLYALSAQDMLKERFEIVVMLGWLRPNDMSGDDINRDFLFRGCG